ncbi:hypothetical protein EGR_04566 [Echinococcus granulosus]|uniref:Uncharacterized protein n=1 Tax=Echinococcus granulosus TaxID=6210 RepID=W6UQG8_ECHGR|nr:hypothetical protein EGR_04566 [Echinococcus granulosus]EUB60547.1 hypothetical protein EGR_04566 [Echinococcus granulosus]
MVQALWADYLEEPQLTFRINENLFTVPSYLNWVSNKPRPLEPEPITSGESSISSHRGAAKRSSLSRVFGNGTMDLATQQLLFKEVDPMGRPPPVASKANTTTDGGLAAVTSVAGQGHKISTMFVSNRTAARHLMSRSCHATTGGAEAGGAAEDDEIDGPEIARLMRRFWPRDLNFFGGSAASSGSRSVRDSRSSSTSAHRPTVLNLRGTGDEPAAYTDLEDIDSTGANFEMSDTSVPEETWSPELTNENRSAPDSFAGDFESPVDLDWDHEPGAYTTPQRQSFRRRGVGIVKSWYTSPFESSFEMVTGTGESSQRRNCRTLPSSATVTIKDAVPMMAQSACFSGQMVDSGFADP